MMINSNNNDNNYSTSVLFLHFYHFYPPLPSPPQLFTRCPIHLREYTYKQTDINKHRFHRHPPPHTHTANPHPQTYDRFLQSEGT